MRLVFLGEPARTAYDVHFTLLGIPVRVTPFFWLVSFILGYNFAAQAGQPPLVLLWIGTVFLSILVHEFGHALAFRSVGRTPRVVLYHFGGLAIADESDQYLLGPSQPLDSKRQIYVSAAGPLAQLALAVGLFAAIRLAGYQVPWAPLVPDEWRGASAAPLPTDYLEVLVLFLLLINVYWAVLNLLPVYPLDGGQIVRELMLWFDVREGIKYSLILSVATAGVVCVYALMSRHFLLLLLFASLAFSSYSVLRTYLGQSDWGGGGPRW